MARSVRQRIEFLIEDLRTAAARATSDRAPWPVLEALAVSIGRLEGLLEAAATKDGDAALLARPEVARAIAEAETVLRRTVSSGPGA